MEACLHHQKLTRHPDPFHVTAHFLRATSVGPFEVRIHTIRSGRGMSNVHADLVQDVCLPHPNIVIRASYYDDQHPISCLRYLFEFLSVLLCAYYQLLIAGMNLLNHNRSKFASRCTPSSDLFLLRPRLRMTPSPQTLTLQAPQRQRNRSHLYHHILSPALHPSGLTRRHWAQVL